MVVSAPPSTPRAGLSTRRRGCSSCSPTAAPAVGHRRAAGHGHPSPTTPGGSGDHARGGDPLNIAERREWEAAAARRGGADLSRTALARREDLPSAGPWTRFEPVAPSASPNSTATSPGSRSLPLIARGLTGQPSPPAGSRPGRPAPSASCSGGSSASPPPRTSRIALVADRRRRAGTLIHRSWSGSSRRSQPRPSGARRRLRPRTSGESRPSPPRSSSAPLLAG